MMTISELFQNYFSKTPERDQFIDFINMVYEKAKREALSRTADEKKYQKARVDVGFNSITLEAKDFDIKNINIMKMLKYGWLPKEWKLSNGYEDRIYIDCNYYATAGGFDWLRNSDYADTILTVFKTYGIPCHIHSNLD